MRMLAGERYSDVLDAVGHGIGLVDGEVRAVFRGGHLRKWEVVKTAVYTMEELRKFDEEHGYGPYASKKL
jgi:hypothetical protein